MDGPLFDRLRVQQAAKVPPGLRVETRPEGIYLPHIDLYLDPRVPVARAFISHAHADHAATSREGLGAGPASDTIVLRFASTETVALLRARYDDVGPLTALPWNTPLDLGNARVSVVHAGHILGAAALVVESPAGTLIYTGDIKPGAGLTHPAAALPLCDTLIIESTFGLPIFAFPPAAESHERMLAFAQETLAAGETPVFLAYSLGKGQEIARLLGSNGVHVRAHGSMTKLNVAYRALGIELPLVRPYAKDDLDPPGALTVPPRERFGAMFKRGKAKGIRVAYVSGWAMLDSSRDRFDADLQVPLSDHASFRELNELVDSCSPKRVIVTHGFADGFARLLRKRGYQAEPLEGAGYEA